MEHRRKFGDGEIAGTITLLYYHHEAIIATLHVHLDHHNCMELLTVRGKVDLIKKIADELIAAIGGKHGKLTVTRIGKDLPS